jgi:sigma-B regulation protein RsbU (phosphoserine phosphatase)
MLSLLVVNILASPWLPNNRSFVHPPTTGTLTYCNAGHNPPYLLTAQNKDPVRALRRTGIPLGVLETATWEQHSVQIGSGETLVLYTDGIPEAQNRHEEFFGEKRLLEIVQGNLGCSAQDIAILNEL